MLVTLIVEGNLVVVGVKGPSRLERTSKWMRKWFIGDPGAGAGAGAGVCRVQVVVQKE